MPRSSSAMRLRPLTFAFLKDRFDAIHWHNKWNTIPETGSPYDLWLRELSGDLDAAADGELASAL